ncbi:MFS transporter [Hydrogeniiclostridium mannosilyticum]|uniref:MFS transporter n=1 Tax=Hydrogeniiclostridium mannosilyticum TaxID=2764322 RepID=UPI0018AC7AF9|nr:MFS transporter [Hydrogeniiclostridium mannosilyticum]
MALTRKLHNGAIQMCASAHIYGQETAPRSRRNIMLSSLVYNVVFNIINGTYLTGFCLAMGADANYVNIIVVIMSICNMFQLVSPLIFERLKQRKRLIILLRAAAHAINLLVIPLIAMSGLAVETLLPVIGVLFGAAQLINALIAPGLQVWHIGCIPEEKRLGYFSLFSVLNCIITYGSLFLAGIFADILVRSLGDHYALPTLRLVFLMLAALDILFLTRIHEYPNPPGAKPSLRQMLRCIPACPAYMKIIGIAALWNFVANVPSQYYTTYLLDNLNLSYTFINSVNLFNIVAVILLTPLWKKLIQRKGLRGTLFLALLFYAPHALGLSLVGTETVFLYPLSSLYGIVFSVGFTLCFTLVPYIDLPHENRTVYMALYNTCCALAALLGVLAGRLIYTLFGSMAPIILFGAEIAPARLLVIGFSLFLFLAAFLSRAMLKKQPESTA